MDDLTDDELDRIDVTACRPSDVRALANALREARAQRDDYREAVEASTRQLDASTSFLRAAAKATPCTCSAQRARAEKAEAEVERLRAATAEHVAALDDAEGQVERLHREVIDLRTARNKDRETVAGWARAVEAVRALADDAIAHGGTILHVNTIHAALDKHLGGDHG